VCSWGNSRSFHFGNELHPDVPDRSCNDWPSASISRSPLLGPGGVGRFWGL